ncbi:MAG: LysE family translocator, partial [Actinomycetota bacterium]|nr:LysE family translocator [Actinomycetota bacterium]
MEVQQLPAFVAASALLMFIPGVDMAFVTRQVILHGRRAAFGTLAGLLVGGLVHAAFAALGLSAILLASAGLYTVIKTLGAVYLIAVGVQTVWTSWHKSSGGGRTATSSSRGPVTPMAPRRAFALGFASDLTNPKV